MEIVLHDGTPVYLEDFRFYKTYGDILVESPNAKSNARIIKKGLEILYKKTNIAPYFIAAEPKVYNRTKIINEFFPDKEKIELLPDFILTAELVHVERMYKLPLMWMDNIEEDMSLSEIIERSGIKRVDFDEMAKKYN